MTQTQTQTQRRKRSTIKDKTEKQRHIIHNFFENEIKYTCPEVNLDQLVSILESQLDFIDNIPEEYEESLYKHQGGQLLIKKDSEIVELADARYYNDTNIEHINNILEIFQEIPPLTEDIVVYSGSVRPINNFKKQFISTSICVAEPFANFTDKHASRNRRCCLYEITLTKGCKVIPLFFDNMYIKELEILLFYDILEFTPGNSYVKNTFFKYEKAEAIERPIVTYQIIARPRSKIYQFNN